MFVLQVDLARSFRLLRSSMQNAVRHRQPRIADVIVGLRQTSWQEAPADGQMTCTGHHHPLAAAPACASISHTIICLLLTFAPGRPFQAGKQYLARRIARLDSLKGSLPLPLRLPL